MEEILLSHGVQKLLDLLVREFERLKGVGEKLRELEVDLMSLKSFAVDADAKKHEMETVKTCVGQINEIVLDAEDIIETFILKEERRKANGIMKHMRRLSCIKVDRIKVASDIESINKRISRVIQRMQGLGVQQITVQGSESSHPLQGSLEDKRETFPSKNENDLVGLEEKVENLVGYLVNDDSSQIIAITGMGGMGKTTVAREAYNDERVKKHFSCLVWVCLSKKFNTQNVWETIFQNLSSKHDEHRESNKSDDGGLHGKLFRLLETSNSLIVLDDIWKEDDWDKLKPVFPPNKGWKVILTSRNKNVALHADPTCKPIELVSLTPKESWTLFQRTLFPRKDTTEYKIDVEMEKLGEQMIKHCGGLPLAVKVLGRLLAARYSLSEWNRLSKNIGCRIIETSSVYKILYLSFEELPSYLKHCFLYFAHFPEDYTIDVEMLSYLWAAEGILRPRPRHFQKWTTREVADECIEELVRRNMVISDKDELTSRYEICRLHDMMREVCLHKAELEDFVHFIDKEASTSTSQSPYTSRRLLIEYSYPTPVDINGCSKNPKLRSFLCIHDHCIHDVRISFTRLQLMRVLDLSFAWFKGRKLPSSIGKLIHLRYLSLNNAEVDHLPSSMRNLKKLLYLDLDVRVGYPMYVPDLSEMRELEYLTLPCFIHDKVKMKLGNLVNLVTLKNFSTKNSSVGDLHQMTKLKTLSIKYNGGCEMETLSSTIRELRHVENLDIRGDVFNLTDDREFVLDCNDCTRITHLYLCINMSKLPGVQHLPSGLTTIYLNYCRLKEDPMPILEKLKKLKVVTLAWDSFRGKKMICSGDGFPTLQKLKLRGLGEWEEWEVKEGSMPLLHTLVIDECKKFKQLDPLQFITSLKTLDLWIRNWDTAEEWKERLSEGGEDYYNVQHIPHVQIH